MELAADERQPLLNGVSDLGSGTLFTHRVAVHLVPDDNLLFYPESGFESLSNPYYRVLGFGLAKPHGYLVTPGPDVDYRPVDHHALALKTLANQTKYHFQPEIVQTRPALFFV